MGRLENKHRGGLNNEKGIRYEEFYAVYKIASFLADFVDQQILIKSQVEGAYVDDLLIINEGHRSYYQLKNVQALLKYWSEIVADFLAQIVLSVDKKEDFDVTLVYSDTTFETTISEELRPYTVFEYFPYADSLYEVIMQSSSFKNTLARLCVLENATADTLYKIAKYLIGEWCSIDRQKGITIAELAKHIKESKVNTILDSDREISEDCINILNAIPDFSYKIRGKNIVWETTRSRNNSTEWTQELENKIIEISPCSAKEIFKIL